MLRLNMSQGLRKNDQQAADVHTEYLAFVAKRACQSTYLWFIQMYSGDFFLLVDSAATGYGQITSWATFTAHNMTDNIQGSDLMIPTHFTLPH